MAARAGATALVGSFAYLLYWFSAVDFYHRHFFDVGLLARRYEWARLAFIAYFAWLFYVVGAAILALIGGQREFSRRFVGALLLLYGKTVRAALMRRDRREGGRRS